MPKLTDFLLMLLTGDKVHFSMNGKGTKFVLFDCIRYKVMRQILRLK